MLLSCNPPEDEWLAALLYNYVAWMERNSRLNRRDAVALFVGHVCIFFSMGYYAVGVAFGLFFPQVEWWFSLLAAIGLGVSCVGQCSQSVTVWV